MISKFAFEQVKFCWEEHAYYEQEHYPYLTPAVKSGEFGAAAYTEAKGLVEYAMERARQDLAELPEVAEDIECHLAELNIALQELTVLAK